ncbi:MAG: CDP-diacylglycerol--glycerol-3-phosphate 3-phosphatidyltransferase [Bradymonadia bacterium]|jgi:CDP-diacylglycerol--glycerol-3-phosphate 3-phosphatidyltransferase
MADFSKDIRTLPNVITLTRIALLPVAVVAYLMGFKALGLMVGVVVGGTDYLDGYLARKRNQVTYLGAILDQFADLVFEVTLLVLLVTEPLGPTPFVIVVYLFREFWVGSIRRFMATHQIDISSNMWGKVKTNFLCWNFVLYFTHTAELIPQIEPFLGWFTEIALWVGLAIGYVGAWLYTKQFVAGYRTLESP